MVMTPEEFINDKNDRISYTGYSVQYRRGDVSLSSGYDIFDENGNFVTWRKHFSRVQKWIYDNWSLSG